MTQQEILTNLCQGTLTDFQQLQEALKLALPTIFFTLIIMFVITILWFVFTGFKDNKGKKRINLFQPNVLITIFLSFGFATIMVIFIIFFPIISQWLNKIFL